MGCPSLQQYLKNVGAALARGGCDQNGAGNIAFRFQQRESYFDVLVDCGCERMLTSKTDRGTKTMTRVCQNCGQTRSRVPLLYSPASAFALNSRRTPSAVETVDRALWS